MVLSICLLCCLRGMIAHGTRDTPNDPIPIVGETRPPRRGSQHGRDGRVRWYLRGSSSLGVLGGLSSRVLFNLVFASHLVEIWGVFKDGLRILRINEGL